MSKLRLPLCLAYAVAPLIVASASLPSVADETYTLKNIISLPDGQTLRAFDISFVDPESHRYALAASATAPFPNTGPASNPRVVIVDTLFNVVINEFNGTPSFAGNCQASAVAPRNTFGGPNGVMIIEKGRNADIWVADGPKFLTSCDPTSGGGVPTVFSSVKVLDLHTGATKAVIPTGGKRRADELCYNPVSDVVLIANDDVLDNFITFIGEDRYNVLQKMTFDGTDPMANKIIANGIEQCQFDPRDGKFYLNIPNTGTATPPGPGVVLRISGSAPFHVEKVFTPACGGATGMAIGPDHQIGLACSTSAEIIDDRTGNQIALLSTLGGADEMWFDPRSNHYFFAISVPGSLGVADAGPPPSADSPNTATASGSHSVAADPITRQVYVPIRAGAGTVCSSGVDVFGTKGNDALGCIAVYTAPGDKDDGHDHDHRADNH